MTGKQKCAILKQIRREIAEKNDIRLVIEECTHKGKCRGTCPRCEAEVRFLEAELEKRKKAGARTVLAGVSAGLLAASLTACAPVDRIKNAVSGFGNTVSPLEGDVPREVTETDGGEEVRAEVTEGELLPEEEVMVTEGEPVVEFEKELLAGDPVADSLFDEEPTAGLPLPEWEESLFDGAPSDGDELPASVEP